MFGIEGRTSILAVGGFGLGHLLHTNGQIVREDRIVGIGGNECGLIFDMVEIWRCIRAIGPLFMIPEGKGKNIWPTQRQRISD